MGILFFACFCLAISLRAQPALPSLGGGFSVAHHTQAKLFLSAVTAKPGETIWAGVDLKMDPEWHTYWKNPGDAGMATEIKWQLPPGITNGEIEWPLPQKFPPIEVTTYGYTNEVMLLVPLKIAMTDDWMPHQIVLKANVSWLECKDVCIPANQDVEAQLKVGSETKNSTDAALIKTWEKRVPQTNSFYQFQKFQARWEPATNGDTRSFVMSNGSGGVDQSFKLDAVDFFPDASDQFEVQSPTEIISAYSADIQLRKFVKKFSGGWPKEISGVVVIQMRNSRESFEVKMPVTDKAPAGETISSASRTGVPPVSNLSEINSETGKMPVPQFWQMLLYAFIGGLILNVMPCVLPVIALKVLGFVSEARSSPRRVRALGGIYAVGVLFSFLVMAAIVIGVKAAGHQAGWGMQFGSPVFIVCLTTLVTLVALNLFGVFEVTLGGRTLDAAGNLASRHGASGAFFNGVLATTLATPCTAPFLAPALGFAFSQPAMTIVSIFLTVGLGLASPYVLLSWNPAWLKFLPKPGAWMEKFKIAMGFPILGAAIWLFILVADDLDRSRWFRFGLFLIALAFASWIWGEFVQRGKKHRLTSAIISILLIGGFGVYAYFQSPSQIQWQPWSPEAVAQARAAGKPVLVDFTASWCVTCNAIVKPALENEAVAAKLKEIGAVALLADYTRVPPQITAEISKYGGAGVPLVLIYPKNPGAAAIVLPQPSPLQLPSGYEKVVLDALDQAAH